MTEPLPGGRRRIDRVLAEDYLDGLGSLPIAEVRELRLEAQQEEADLSYIRRLLQGRIDIVQAELVRRGDGGTGGDGGSVVDQLPEILADGTPGRSSARHITVQPSRVDEHRRQVEKIWADVGISDVTSQSPAQLRAALDVVADYERRVSRTRHQVQRVTDACNAEIARRYRDGEANVDDLLRDPG